MNYGSQWKESTESSLYTREVVITTLKIPNQNCHRKHFLMLKHPIISSHSRLDLCDFYFVICFSEGTFSINSKASDFLDCLEDMFLQYYMFI